MDGLNIFGDGSGVYIFTFMGMCGELLIYQRILLTGKAKVFVVTFAIQICDSNLSLASINKPETSQSFKRCDQTESRRMCCLPVACCIPLSFPLRL